MSNVGFATLSVIPSFQGFQSKLTAGTVGPMAAAGKDGGRKYGDAAGREAGDRFRRGWSEKMKGFAPLAGIAAGAGLVSLFKGAIDEASALSESGNKINVIFGDAAETVNAFADSASEGLGQSDLQARNAAATFGVYGKAAGLAGQDLAAFSTDLTALASDLASFYDSSVEEAIQAIGSGLRGEAEPLRRFGVLLDDATLRAEAMRMGLIKTTKQALTPQQKALAAQAVIMAQTADAQGDFARTSDGLANSQRDLAADYADLRAELGAKLLPATQAFVGFLKDDALPALEATGGAVSDAVSAFRSLPAPVQGAAAAFVALRIAAATGVSTAAVAGVTKMRGAVDGLRIRTMLAGDAFREARAGSLMLSGNSGKFTAPVGRMTASLRGLQAGAVGAGAGLKRGLGSAMGLLGGPWGIALAAGTAALATFWQENQKAAARVDALSEALNKQTGELTKHAYEAAYAALSDDTRDAARDMGIEITTLTEAALGNKDAMDAVTAATSAYFNAADNQVDASLTIKRVTDAVGRGNEELDNARQKWQESKEVTKAAAEAMRDNARETDGASRSLGRYATTTKEARDAILDLIDAENERRNKLVSDRRDRLALLETMRAAREEAAKGKKTLDENTKAGQENWRALLDLADQWNNSSPKVQKARGAYKQMRETFVEVADEMGYSREEAVKLADEILALPKRKDMAVNVVGGPKALAWLKELQAQAENLRNMQLQVWGGGERHTGGRSVDAGFFSGGYTGNYAPTSIAGVVHGQEYVQPKSVVDYYGRGFMEALHRKEIPKVPGYRDGGYVQERPVAAAAGVVVNVGTVMAQDYGDFMRQVNRRVRVEAGGGVNF